MKADKEQRNRKMLSELNNAKDNFSKEIYQGIRKVLISVMLNDRINYNEMQFKNITFYYDPDEIKITSEIFKDMYHINENNKGEKSMVVSYDSEADEYYIY